MLAMNVIMATWANAIMPINITALLKQKNFAMVQLKKETVITAAMKVAATMDMAIATIIHKPKMKYCKPQKQEWPNNATPVLHIQEKTTIINYKELEH